MQTRVGPEERRKQHAKLRGGNPQLVLQHRRGNRKVPAIDVIDKDGNGEQENDNQKRAGDARALGWPGSGHEELGPSSLSRLRFATCFDEFGGMNSIAQRPVRQAQGWPASMKKRAGTHRREAENAEIRREGYERRLSAARSGDARVGRVAR